jgi:hypothetical protein
MDLPGPDLMVMRDARFEGVRLTAVEVSGQDGLLISYVAEQGAWFDPDDGQADDDGWIREVGDIDGEMMVVIEDGPHYRYCQQLAAYWLEDQVVLRAAADLASQAVMLFNPASFGTDQPEAISIRMPAEDLDRV